MNFRKRLKKILFRFIGLFVVMFLLKLGSMYLFPSSSGGFRGDLGHFAPMGDMDFDQSASNGSVNLDGAIDVTNIASSKYEVRKEGTGQQAQEVVTVDQKYEKTGTLQCHSSKFEEDKKVLDQSIESHEGIIQYQQKSGNKGRRFLSLQIGIPPGNFEPFIEDLKEKQNVVSITVTQKDKTNEYRELNSRRTSLTNTRNSLAELKTKGGKIEEYVDLENRILEIDEQLRELGVSLGNFDTENEFCTVKLTLKEGKERVAKKAGFWTYFLKALEWTIPFYLMLVFGFFLALGCSYLLIVMIDRLKVMDWVKEKLED